jgi:FMN reductase
MSSTLIITGSPSPTSRTTRLGSLVSHRLAAMNVDSSLLELRSLPAEELLHARVDAPAIAEAVASVERARGVVVATPIYKSAYSGLLKTFLDLLPQFALRDKVVLPLATGGSLAHVLSIDYALRPVLSSLAPLHVVPGLFVLDTQMIARPDGGLELGADFSGKLDEALAAFAVALSRAATPHGNPS